MTKRQTFDYNLAALFEAVGRNQVIEALGAENVAKALMSTAFR